MLRLGLLATVFATGVAMLVLPAGTHAQQQPQGSSVSPSVGSSISQNPQGMLPGQRVQLGPMLGQRTVRQVMISNDGGGIEVVYDMGPDAPQSQRVLRLENINGMLEVVYDTRPGSGNVTATGGTPRLVQKGGGMYEVTYDK